MKTGPFEKHTKDPCAARNRMQYDGQWFRDRRHGNGTLTIESAGKASGIQCRFAMVFELEWDANQVLYTYDGQWQSEFWHKLGK